ncbi:serine aminopeptidase domain-containing protein [Ferrimonas lipolytica]|uniref:Serine aminopeptidase S33 domain-containing protein n=1 Tax=Ferrimonas lipolytica TaxID=2724191 RepID=A0A6H1UBH4_9GAMM|nr:alpha/beta hydrolase [Ferrimonas lipolytica]QIZ76188.1 hypothetical protein HER31_04335 [Ferrimonas lipolytica]
MQQQYVSAADGQPVSLNWFEPDSATTTAWVLIAPALGVPQRFYHDFANYLVGNGFGVMTLDYRGIAQSPLQVTDDAEVKMSDWGLLDLPIALQTLKAKAAGQPCHVIGHSCGGQLLGLSGELDGIASITCIGASVPALQYYHGQRLKMWLLWRLILPLLCMGKRFPAQKLGIAKQSIPSGIIRQWASWGRSNHYLFEPKNGFDLSGYQDYQQRLLSIGFADDDYAPPAAVLDLGRRYSHAERSERIYGDSEVNQVGGIGHFNYFRRRHQPLWPELVDWLTRPAS